MGAGSRGRSLNLCPNLAGEQPELQSVREMPWTAASKRLSPHSAGSAIGNSKMFILFLLWCFSITVGFAIGHRKHNLGTGIVCGFFGPLGVIAALTMLESRD